MSYPSLFAAQLLETSASAYSAYAANLLLEQHPDIGRPFGSSALREWQANLKQRIFELSAALGVEEPKIFLGRIRWVAKAYQTRGLTIDDIRVSLACLRQILAEELPTTAQENALAYLDSAMNVLDEPPTPAAMGLDPEERHGRLALEYLQKILSGDSREAIEHLLRHIDDGLDPRDAYFDVLLPAQREVGELWHQGELRIAEEHFVTATTERAMTLLAHRMPRAELHGKGVIAAAVAGNTHGLAVRVISDFFEAAGWRAACLGPDVPAEDIAAATEYFNADLVVLSAALPSHLKVVRQSIDAVRELERHRPIKILVGGIAFRETPDLWRRLGADGYAATAQHAVDLGARLLEIQPS